MLLSEENQSIIEGIIKDTIKRIHSQFRVRRYAGWCAVLNFALAPINAIDLLWNNGWGIVSAVSLIVVNLSAGTIALVMRVNHERVIHWLICVQIAARKYIASETFPELDRNRAVLEGIINEGIK